MKLKSFGCSFIFGTDLSDDGQQLPYATTGSRLTWPALVANHFGYEYETYARPGSGNLQILERLLNQINPDDPAIYVIGWTYIDRFDYVDEKLTTPWLGAKWGTLLPVDQDPVADNYFRFLHSEYSDKFRNLTYIKIAIDCLQQGGCQFVMTNMDYLLSCKRWHTTRATSYMFDYVEPYLCNFEKSNFLDWSLDQGFAISDLHHPLDDAHQAAADHILSRWTSVLKQ